MIQRLRQFARALTAKISPAERAWVNGQLPAAARPFFFAMAVPDQAHALNVARTAERIYGQLDSPCREKIDYGLLLRLALLHDIGRKRGDMGTWGKSAAVLISKFFPHLSRRLAKEAEAASGPAACLRQLMRVYYFHGAIGAAKLAAIGLTHEAALVARHHERPSGDDPPELSILRQADELN